MNEINVDVTQKESKSARVHNEDLVIKVLRRKGGYYHEGKAYLNGRLLCLAIDGVVDFSTIDENDYWDEEEAETFIESLELLRMRCEGE